MTKKKTSKVQTEALERARAAARRAAPKDVFCLAWIGSRNVAEVVGTLTEAGYSATAESSKARAERVRKAKRGPVALPRLEGEGRTASLNMAKIKAALLAREKDDQGALAQLELTSLLAEIEKGKEK